MKIESNISVLNQNIAKDTPWNPVCQIRNRFFLEIPEIIRMMDQGRRCRYLCLLEAEKEIHFAQEVLAECWASAKNSKKPPIIHRFFANMLEKRLKQQ